MRTVVMCLIILCILYMVLRSLVWGLHLLMWSLHVLFPVLMLTGLVAVFIKLYLRRR
jgi:hypothetical protein